VQTFSKEDDLIRRAKDDPDAFGELYEMHFRQIYRYVYSQVRSHPETQDIVSDTFLKALRAIESYTPTGKPFIVWLYRIARNTTIDYFRRANREVEVDWLELMAEEAQLEQIEYRDWLDQAMKHLTEDQRVILRLHYIQDMKFKDIAKVTNRTEGAVKAMALRAIGRLRSVMVKEEVTYGA
jgi:RNA polymerase sigma-70 factor (ECF subfamily)